MPWSLLVNPAVTESWPSICLQEEKKNCFVYWRQQHQTLKKKGRKKNSSEEDSVNNVKAGNAVGRGDSGREAIYQKVGAVCSRVQDCCAAAWEALRGQRGLQANRQCGSAAASGKSWHLRPHKRARLQSLFFLLSSFTAMPYDAAWTASNTFPRQNARSEFSNKQKKYLFIFLYMYIFQWPLNMRVHLFKHPQFLKRKNYKHPLTFPGRNLISYSEWVRKKSLMTYIFTETIQQCVFFLAVTENLENTRKKKMPQNLTKQ